MHSTQTLGRRGARKPAIRISETDYDLIANFAMNLETRSPELAQTLFDEIDRAKICPVEKLPLDVVTLGSEVSYLDESTNLVRRVKLVMPNEADIEKGKVSISTPIGAGLIGLRVGQSIDWPGLDGRPRILKILDVARAQ